MAAAQERIEFVIGKINNLWRKIYSLHNQHDKSITNVSQRRVITTIDLHPNLSQSNIASYVDMEPQNLLRVIDALEEGKYLKRSPSPTDRRIKTLSLLPKGKQFADKCYKIGDMLRDDILKGVSIKHMEILEGVLKRMIENLSSITEQK